MCLWPFIDQLILELMSINKWKSIRTFQKRIIDLFLKHSSWTHRESFKGNLKYNVIFHLLYIHNIEQQEKQCSYFSQVQFCSKTSSWSMLHLNKSNPFVFLTARKNFTKKNEWIDIAINCFYYIYSSYISRFTAHIIFIHDHHYF